MSEPKATIHRMPFLSVPTWDISNEEISEWKETRDRRFAACTAEQIRDGRYDNGQEIYPDDSSIYREITREFIARDMELLAERGMVRITRGRWYAIAPGRMEPSILRMAGGLLARRDDLPAALAAELESWKRTLDALEAPDDTPTGRETARRAG